MLDGDRDRPFDRLQERVDELERQVRQLNRSLGLARLAEAQPHAPPAPESVPATIEPAPVTVTAPSMTPLVAPIDTPPLAPPVAPPVAAAVAVAELETGHPLAPATIRQLTAPARASQSSVSSDSIERFVGAKLAAWFGALVVIAAVAVFVKFAYDQGWLQKMPPAVRLAVAYGFSIGLLAVGAIVGRQWGRFAAVGLTAAGVGSLYVTTIAGYSPLQVFSPTVALMVATAIAVIGGAITYRAHMVPVGVISLLGGYLAPVILGTIDEPGLAVPVHLTALLCIGLALASSTIPNAMAMRATTVVFHLIAAAAWFLNVGYKSPIVTVLFGGVWWGLTVGESLLLAMRGNGGPHGRSSVVAPVVATAAFTMISALAIGSSAPTRDPFSYVPLALALLSAALAVQFCGGLASLRPRAEGVLQFGDAATPEERSIADALWTFGVVLWLQCGVLLIAGIGLFLDRTALAAAWIAVAIGAFELSLRLRTRAVSFFALPVLLLGTTAAIVASFLGGRGPTPGPWDFDFASSRAGLVIACVANAFVAHRWDAASRTARNGGWETAVAALAALGLTVAWIVGAGRSAGLMLAVTLTLAPALWCALAFRHDRVRWPLGLACAVTSLVVVTILTLRYAIDDKTTIAGSTFVLVAAASVLWLFAARTSRSFSEYARQALIGGGFVVLGLGMALEHLLDPAVQLGGVEARRPLCFGVMALAGISCVGVVLAELRRWPLVATMCSAMTIMAVAMWLSFCTLLPRMRFGAFDEPFLANLTMASGAVVLVATVIAAIALHRVKARSADRLMTTEAITAEPAAEPHMQYWYPITIGALLLTVLWMGSFLVDEAVQVSNATVDKTARQAGLSIWWGVFSLALIAAGFARRLPPLRYAGLAGLGVVALKVITIDLASSSTIWKVIAMLAAGFALVATSVVYVRVGRMLDAKAGRSDAA
ncbi:MAG: DUF2339 domain-containing protein [Phycisphaerae bacterium]|nr:DUF2339 domain-containing protein [Phycisphaerae bacterium]